MFLTARFIFIIDPSFMQRGSDSHSLKEVVRLNEIITAKLSESKASPWSSFWSSKFVVNKWDETFGLTSL